MKWINLLVLSLVMSLAGCSLKLTKEKEEQDPQRAEFEQQFKATLSLIEEGKEQEGIEQLKTLSMTHPNYSGPFVNLGILAFKEQDLELAQHYFEQANAINPKQKQALNYLGVLAREAGRFEEAESYYRKALEVDPSYQAAIRNLAILLDLYQGRLEEALALYEQYQGMQDEPDAKVKDWIFDLKQRLK